MGAVRKRRPDGEEWTPLGDWRNTVTGMISTFAYCVPWFVFDWCWPLHGALFSPGQHLPPLSFTLGMGIGWFVAMLLLCVVVVPSVLVRAGWDDLAWRWRGGAFRGAGVGIAVTAGSMGMRLPLSPTLQVLATIALILVEYFAVRWLKRKLWDT
jgi:hypothetical protein